MSPPMGEYTQEDADADIAVHAALTVTHGTVDDIADQTDIETHRADLDAHTRNPFEELRTGEYCVIWPFWGGRSNYTIVVDRIYAVPVHVPRNLTVDRIGIEVTTFAAGAAARLGIYNNGVNLYPGSLLLDAGIVDVSANGVKTIIINQALTKGIYWVVVISDGGPIVRSSYAAYSCTPLGKPAGDLAGANEKWYVAQAYGVLPAAYPAGGSMEDYLIYMPMRLLSLD